MTNLIGMFGVVFFVTLTFIYFLAVYIVVRLCKNNFKRIEAKSYIIFSFLIWVSTVLLA